nr:hypothetical protein [Tanacetum cinerariifolium]
VLFIAKGPGFVLWKGSWDRGKWWVVVEVAERMEKVGLQDGRKLGEEQCFECGLGNRGE